MSKVARILVPLMCIFIGGVASAFLIFVLMTDEVGRHQQLVYTIERALEDKAVQLSRDDILNTVSEMYPRGEIIVEENAVYVHRLEFHFSGGFYTHGDVGNYKK